MNIRGGAQIIDMPEHFFPDPHVARHPFGQGFLCRACINIISLGKSPLSEFSRFDNAFSPEPENEKIGAPVLGFPFQNFPRNGQHLHSFAQSKILPPFYGKRNDIHAAAGFHEGV